MCAIHEIANDGNNLKLCMYDPYTQVKISCSGNKQTASANIGVVLFLFFPLQDREVYYILSSFPSEKVTSWDYEKVHYCFRTVGIIQYITEILEHTVL